MAGAAVSVVLLAAVAAGCSSEDGKGKAQPSWRARMLKVCIAGAEPGENMWTDRATNKPVVIPFKRYCREYAALSVPFDKLRPAQLTTAFGVYDGHVERRFYEARWDGLRGCPGCC